MDTVDNNNISLNKTILRGEFLFSFFIQLKHFWLNVSCIVSHDVIE